MKEQGDVMDCEAIRDDMLDVLYGEGGEAAARRVEAHQATCGECRREMADLRRLRADLSQWRLPEALLARPAAPARSRRLSLGLAAAAILILASTAGLGLAGAEVRYDHSGLSVRLGRGTDARALADLERRHREELAALRAELAAVRPPDDRQLLRTVADMIRESESRQDEARLASLRVLQQRTETQRQYDLARMSAGLSYLDGKAGLQAARTTELVGHLLQASQQK
jgi:anti-sigma factor RsiW